ITDGSAGDPRADRWREERLSSRFASAVAVRSVTARSGTPPHAWGERQKNVVDPTSQRPWRPDALLSPPQRHLRYQVEDRGMPQRVLRYGSSRTQGPVR